MTAKKLLGFLFIAISIILALAIVGQLPRLFQETFLFFKVFTGRMVAYDSSKAITKFIFWILHFSLVGIFWSYGMKWARKT